MISKRVEFFLFDSVHLLDLTGAVTFFMNPDVVERSRIFLNIPCTTTDQWTYIYTGNNHHMNYSITDTDLSGQIRQHKLELPQELGFIPENIAEAVTKDDFLYPDTLTELRKRMRLQQLNVPTLGDQKVMLLGRKSADVYLPGIFFGVAVLSANPDIISISLNLVSSFVYDLLKGNPGKKTVSFEIYVEKKCDKQIKKITYKGPPEGIKDLANVVKQLEK